LSLRNAWGRRIDGLSQWAGTFPVILINADLPTDRTLRGLTLGRLLDLKLEWGTSVQAILEHAHRLGRVTVDVRQRFYKAMNARGWKITEPGSDRLPTETPELVHAVGERLRTAGLTDDEIAQLTGAPNAEQASPFLRSAHQLHVV